VSVVVGLIVLGMAAADAQPTWLMRYKWTEGESITWLVDLEARGAITTSGMGAVPQTADISIVMHMSQDQTVEAVDPDGNATVLTEIGPMEMDVTLPVVGAQHITIDPKTGKVTAGGADVPAPDAVKRFLGRPFKHVLTPRGEVLEMELPFELADLMELGSTAPMQALKAMQQQPMIFPEQAIAPGYCWINRRDLPPKLPEGEQQTELPPITQTVTYKLAGFEDVAGTECARIEMLGVMEIGGVVTMPMQPRAGGPGLPPQMPIPQGTTKVGPAHFSISGTIWFDREAGQPLKAEAAMLLDVRQETEGSITVEGQQHDLHVQVELRDFEVLLTLVRAQEG